LGNSDGIIIKMKPPPKINGGSLGGPAFMFYWIRPFLCTPARIAAAQSSWGRAQILMDTYPAPVALELTIAARAQVTPEGTLLYEWRHGESRSCDAARKYAAQGVAAQDIMKHLFCTTKSLSENELRNVDHHLNNVTPFTDLSYDTENRWVPTPGNLGTAFQRMGAAVGQTVITFAYTGGKWVDQTTGRDIASGVARWLKPDANLGFNDPNASRASWSEIGHGLLGVVDGVALPDRYANNERNYPQTGQLVNAGVLPRGFDAINDFYATSGRPESGPVNAAASVRGYYDEQGNVVSCP
jgi:hypothetical protein